MNRNIIKLLSLSILLYSCSSNKVNKIKSCNDKKISELALKRVKDDITKISSFNETGIGYANAEINYLSAHILNNNNQNIITQTWEDKNSREGYPDSDILEIIEDDYPIIEVYYSYTIKKYRYYQFETELYNYWGEEGTETREGVEVVFWDEESTCPCITDDYTNFKASVSWSPLYYSSFFGLSSIFKESLYGPSTSLMQKTKSNIFECYEDYTKEEICEYYNNSYKWINIMQSRFFEMGQIKFNNKQKVIDEYIKSSGKETDYSKKLQEDLDSKIVRFNLIRKFKDNDKSEIRDNNIKLKEKKETLYARINDPDGYTNVRESKSSKSEILYQIHEGEEFKILDNTGDWWLIEFNDNHGYIHNSRVSIIN